MVSSTTRMASVVAVISLNIQNILNFKRNLMKLSNSSNQLEMLIHRSKPESTPSKKNLMPLMPMLLKTVALLQVFSSAHNLKLLAEISKPFVSLFKNSFPVFNTTQAVTTDQHALQDYQHENTLIVHASAVSSATPLLTLSLWEIDVLANTLKDGAISLIWEHKPLKLSPSFPTASST